MKKNIFIAVISALVIISCSEKAKNNIVEEQEKAHSSTLYKHYLDVDFDASSLKSNKVSDSDTLLNMQIFYSAYKRFSKHIEIKDGLYHLNISNEEINISPKLFKVYSKMLEVSNKEIVKYRKNHTEFELTEGARVMEFKRLKWDHVKKFFEAYGE